MKGPQISGWQEYQKLIFDCDSSLIAILRHVTIKIYLPPRRIHLQLLFTTYMQQVIRATV